MQHSIKVAFTFAIWNSTLDTPKKSQKKPFVTKGCLNTVTAVFELYKCYHFLGDRQKMYYTVYGVQCQQ